MEIVEEVPLDQMLGMLWCNSDEKLDRNSSYIFYVISTCFNRIQHDVINIT